MEPYIERNSASDEWAENGHVLGLFVNKWCVLGIHLEHFVWREINEWQFGIIFLNSHYGFGTGSTKEV